MIEYHHRGRLASIECEGITVDGRWCDTAGGIEIPAVSPDGKRWTKAKKAAHVRTAAAKDGWQCIKGVDACPKVHGMIPAPLPKAKAGQK